MSESKPTVVRTKNRFLKPLAIVVVVLGGFTYFALQIVFYNPNYVVQADDAVLFEIRNKQMVALIGVGMTPPETRGKARELAQQLILHRYIRVELGQKPEDKETKRLLAYVFADTPQGEVFFNEILIRKGYARSEPAAPNLKYRAILDAAEAAARSEHLGIWADSKGN